MTSRHFPDMTFPVDRGVARYEQLKELFVIAEKMKAFGVRVDPAKIAWHIADAQRRASEFKALFLSLTGLPEAALGDSGAGQTKDIRDYFWLTLKAPPVIFHKKTKKPQFNTPTLVIYAKDFKDEPLRSAAAALYGLRAAKTALRFANAYRAVSQRNGGRIHFGFNPLGTKGVRWSSSASFRWYDQDLREWVEYSLNAQNVPSKEPTFAFDGSEVKLAVSMRDCFVPDDGCVFFKADYEALELRLIAYNAGAEKLIRWIEADIDPHMENAKGMFLEAKMPADASKKSHGVYREAAKPCAYAFTYQSPSGRGNDKYPETYKALKKLFPNLQEVYVNVLVNRFFTLHPEIRAMQAGVAKALAEQGRIDLPLTGDFLYLPDSSRGRNQAINYLHQSGGGALINRALIEIDKHTIWTPGNSVVLLQVHDELSGQIREDDVDRYAEIIEAEMGKPAQFGGTFAGVPAGVDIGTSWGTTKKRG
jgi:DNA polymerase-1